MSDRSSCEAEGAILSLAEIISRVAGAMTSGAISPGDLADLRRVAPECPDRPAFWRILVGCVSPEREIPPEQESAWAVVLSGMARMVPYHHRRGRRLGEALATAGYSEGRLLKLLRTRGRTFPDVVRRTCAFLAGKAEPVDWTEFAALVLVTDPEKAEALRRAIARDYFGKTRQEAHS